MKYAQYQKKTPPKPTQPHPIWRGIGCLMMILVPFMSYAAGVLTVNYALQQGYPLPYQLLGAPTLPAFIWQNPTLAYLFAPLLRWENLYAHLTFALVYVVLFGSILAFVYALIYRFVGPPRYTPLDVPPPPVKIRPHKR
jgi:hypothetical protein